MKKLSLFASTTLVTATAMMAAAAPSGAPEFRTITGLGNNLSNPDWGSAGTPLRRMTGEYYADGVSSPAGDDRPNARAASFIVCTQTESIPNAAGASDFIWQWGQFIDHDIARSCPTDPPEFFDILVPLGDPFFDPFNTGTQTIEVIRSNWDPTSGTDPSNPRQQINELTAFVDGSMVYGSDEARAAALRTNDGTGMMKLSAGRLLPWNEGGFQNEGGTGPDLFLAGDIRANEQAALAAMHTLWVREHNYQAFWIKVENPGYTDDEIYERARAIVGAEIQVITYREFLPLLLGDGAIAPYAGYQPTVHPGLINLFANACYRVGHTLLSPNLMRLDDGMHVVPEGNLELRDAFFDPTILTDEGGIEPLLRGLAMQRAQEIDAMVVQDVHNFLFGPPGSGGFDLASLNLQRARDHGLPAYNQARRDLGLTPVTRFDEITSDPEMQRRLESAYGDVELIDPWVGALAEDHVPGAMVGELLREVISEQFEKFRDGDRFWYEMVFSGAELDALEKTTLAHVIRRNTRISGEIQDDVFRVPLVCFADVTGDNEVNIDDLVEVVLAFGTAGGPADVTMDGVVDVDDIVEVVLNWGSCPGA